MRFGALLLSLWAALPVEGVRRPRADAWPAEPLAVLIEHNPWAMVVGADVPRVSLYADGTIIRNEPRGKETPPQLMVSHLTDAELAKVKNAIHPSTSFWRLKDDYNLMPFVTDMMTTEFVVYDGTKFKDVNVYGYAPEAWDPPAFTRRHGAGEGGDQLPAELDRICKLLMALKPRNAVPWQPRYLEVIVWPYEYSPETPLQWPAKWPGLQSPMSFRDGDMVSLMLPGSEEKALRELLRGLGERQAVEIGGKKWAIEYRPVMPGGRWAKEIAKRLAKP